MVSLSSEASELAVGGSLPELRGEYLSGRKAVLPGDAYGGFGHLLCCARSLGPSTVEECPAKRGFTLWPLKV